MLNITWHGHSCFTIKGQNAIVITDPYSENIGLNPPKLSGDAVLVSHSHEGHNNAKAVEGSPKILDWPGEYDVKGVFVKGIEAFHYPQSEEKESENKGKNLIFVIHIDGVNICHLGDLGHKLTNEMAAGIGDIDVLLIPVGAYDTLSAKKAHEVIEQIEPSIVVPMHYKIPGLKMELEPVDNFMKEVGSQIAPLPNLKVKSPTELKAMENTEFVLLEPQVG